MNGDEFCEILQKQLGAKNFSASAKMLGVAPASLAIMRKKKKLGNLQIANFIKRVAEAKNKTLLEGSVETIVEYFPIDAIQKQSYWYPFDGIDHPELQTILKTNIGIYSFYNSEGRLIYLGKAGKNLFGEMIQTFNRPFKGKYVMFAVSHPREKFKPKPDGKVRQITKQEAILADTASFFSAYKVHNSLILPLETLLIRVCANNLINTRMEKQLRQVSSVAAG
jgi:hypothetical protein